jgi:hypothetical protein
VTGRYGDGLSTRPLIAGTLLHVGPTKGKSIAESLANAQTKISSICIYKPRTDSSIAAMAMNQGKLALPHFPSLLHNLSECSVEHDFTGMVAVKVDLHIRSPGSL